MDGAFAANVKLILGFFFISVEQRRDDIVKEKTRPSLLEYFQESH